MEYGVVITRTTGKNLEETTFQDLKEAHFYYEQCIKETPYERVLILLLERKDRKEYLIDVFFKDGIQYNKPELPKELPQKNTNNDSPNPYANLNQ